MSSDPDSSALHAEEAKHEAARQQVDAALRETDPDRRAALLANAMATDPDAVIDALSLTESPISADDLAPQDDEELASLSRTIKPGSSAPSRSGLTEDEGGGGGSGADGERR